MRFYSARGNRTKRKTPRANKNAPGFFIGFRKISVADFFWEMDFFQSFSGAPFFWGLFYGLFLAIYGGIICLFC